MCVKELFPGLVASVLHALDLSEFEGVHGYAADKGDVDSKAAMDAGAIETYERSEFRRRLGAVNADIMLEAVFVSAFVWNNAAVARNSIRDRGGYRTHCGEGAPQSQHRSFPLVFWMIWSYIYDQ